MFFSFSGYCSSVQGYSKYGGLCVKQYTDALPYLNATSRCEADGAHLVHCKSEAHKTALESFFYSEGVCTVFVGNPVMKRFSLFEVSGMTEGLEGFIAYIAIFFFWVNCSVSEIHHFRWDLCVWNHFLFQP